MPCMRFTRTTGRKHVVGFVGAITTAISLAGMRVNDYIKCINMRELSLMDVGVDGNYLIQGGK